MITSSLKIVLNKSISQKRSVNTHQSRAVGVKKLVIIIIIIIIIIITIITITTVAGRQVTWSTQIMQSRLR